MKIGFLIRDNLWKWGGDLAVIHQLISGLRLLGHEGVLASSPFAVIDADFVLISISCLDHRQLLDDIALAGLPFGVLSFHENLQQYFCPAMGLFHFVQNCLDGKESLEALYDQPHLIYYFGRAPDRTFVYNFQRIRKAKLWIANSPTEANVIERDYPGSHIAVIPVTPGIVTRYSGEPDSSFLTFSGLSSNGYLLQVGRFEARKNQLSTILATRDLDIPLVFIATKGGFFYETTCFEAAGKWRKAPTLFICQTLKEMQVGSAKVIPMPNNTKLPMEMLISAYHHAALHIHPAFNELPGLTYFEAARLGTPSIASNWATIQDYFFDPSLGHSKLDGRIVYCNPCDLQEIKMRTEELLGKSFSPLIDHPAMQRTEIDAANDLFMHVDKKLIDLF